MRENVCVCERERERESVCVCVYSCGWLMCLCAVYLCAACLHKLSWKVNT